MPLIEWDESFSVHDETLDGHHRQMVQLLNRAYDDLVSGAPSESLGEVISELLDYATFHFCAEEGHMAQSCYPEVEEHREEHARFVLKVARLHKSFQEGDRHLSFETISFLKNWVTRHIAENDVRYGEFLLRAAKG